MRLSALALVGALTLLLSVLAYFGLEQRGLLGQYDLWMIAVGALAASLGLAGAHALMRHFLPTAIAVSISLTSLLGATFFAAQSDLVTSATGLTVAMGVFAMAYFMMEKGYERRDFRRTLNRLTAQLESQRAETAKARMEQQVMESRDGLLSRITQWSQQFFSYENRAFTNARHRMMAAGYGNDVSVMVYLSMRLILPLALVAVIGPLAVSAYDDQATRIGIVAFSAVLGYYFVESTVSGKITKRMKAIMLEMPDVIDLLVIYTESGKSLDNALHEVVVRSDIRYPTISLEIRKLLRELSILSSRERAYDNFAIRCSADIIKRFVSVIKQAEAIGSPVSKTLRILASDSRRDRIQMAERRAARVPVLIQIPIVMFILPALFLILMGPVAVKLANQLSGVGL